MSVRLEVAVEVEDFPVREHEVQTRESLVLFDRGFPRGEGRLGNVLVSATPERVQDEIEENLRVDFLLPGGLLDEGPVVLEGPRDPISLGHEWMRELLSHRARRTRSTQMPHDD